MKTMPALKRSKHFILTNDKVIRTSLKKQLVGANKHNKSATKIIEELGITHGEARIDIAVVNGIIHGYELKSDVDTLKRLPSQIKIYNSVLDQVTLVVGKNHLHESLKIIPDWWGITIAKFLENNDKVSFCTIRESEQNPEQDCEAIAALLWRSEALNILEKIGQAQGVRSKARKFIYKRLVETLDKPTLCTEVREHLRSRVNWRSDQQYIPSGG